MTTTQRIIKELHIIGAISEQTALNAKEVAELADTKQAHARLCELRDQGLVIASSRTGKNKYWLTLAGVQYAEKMEESKQDQSTDANLNQANNASENNVLSNVDDTNVADSQAIPEGFTPWAGSECPVPLGTMVDVVLKSGSVVLRNTANYREALFLSDQSVNTNGWWNTDSYLFDIIAYRLSEPKAEAVAVPESENPYNPPYEMMGSALIDDVVANNVEAFNRLDDVAEKREIPPPQYNPDDVAFKKADINESWYVVDGIDAQFETSSDAIAAAHDYVATHTMSTTVHIVASRKFAIIKPVVTTELEYL